MKTSTDYNSILSQLHSMHRKFAELLEKANGGLLLIHGIEKRIPEMQKIQNQAVKSVLNQRISLDVKQAQLDEKEKEIIRKKKLQDEAKSEREFNSLRDQIAATEAANAVLSDEILEGLDYLDELKVKADEAKKNLQTTQDLLVETKSNTQKTREKAIEKIHELKNEFQLIEEKLDGDYKMMYQRLFNLKKFDSLAQVNGQCCSGCNTAIPIDRIAKITSCEEAISCPLCGRMLYIPEDYHI